MSHSIDKMDEAIYKLEARVGQLQEQLSDSQREISKWARMHDIKCQEFNTSLAKCENYRAALAELVTAEYAQCPFCSIDEPPDCVPCECDILRDWVNDALKDARAALEGEKK